MSRQYNIFTTINWRHAKHPGGPQRGDTIMEVMICITILGFVLAAAFTLANRNQTSARQSQERSEALQIANSQLELLKTYADINKLPDASYDHFCMNNNATLQKFPGTGPPTDPTIDTVSTKYPANCRQGADSRYWVAIWSGNEAISPQPSAALGAQAGVYVVTVRWDSAGGDIPREDTKIFYAINDTALPFLAGGGGGTGPSVSGFIATPDPVLAGQPLTINWTSNGKKCYSANFSTGPIESPNGPVTITAPTAPGHPTYSLTCETNAGVKTTATTSFTVNAPPINNGCADLCLERLGGTGTDSRTGIAIRIKFGIGHRTGGYCIEVRKVSGGPVDTCPAGGIPADGIVDTTANLTQGNGNYVITVKKDGLTSNPVSVSLAGSSGGGSAN